MMRGAFGVHPRYGRSAAEPGEEDLEVRLHRAAAAALDARERY